MDRQKIVLIFGAALVCAFLATWFLYSRTKAPKQEARVTLMAAARDLVIGALVKDADLRKVSYPAQDVPKGAILDAKSAVGRVALFPIAAGEPLIQGKLSGATTVEGASSTIPAGYRAMSIQINETSGVAGLVQPGARVDVLFTRPGSMAEAITATVLQNVKVLSIGRNLVAGQQPTDSKQAQTRTPVATLLVTPEDAQKLELAKNQGKLSLSLRNPSDTQASAAPSPITTEELDPVISARIVRARRGRTTNFAGRPIPNLEDPRVWQELTGEKKPQDEDREKRQAEEVKKKEAEKPRWVVDVYRGDKHVQELFR